MRTIGNFGYHVSAAHYLAGENQLKKDGKISGPEHNQFIFVAVEPTPPYLVAVYYISPRDLELGQWVRRQALNSIKEARKEKEWPGYNRDQAIETDLPNYLFMEMGLSKI
jgi:hypothetical protein